MKQVFGDAENFSSSVIPTHKSPFFVLMDGEDHKRIRSVVALVFSQKNVLKWERSIEATIKRITENFIKTGNGDIFEAWADPIPLATLSVLFGLATDKNALIKLHSDAIAINRALFVTGGTGPRRKNSPNWPEKFSISWSLLKNIPKLFKLRKLIGNEGMKELKLMTSMVDKKIETPRPNFNHIPQGIEPMLDMIIAFAEKLKAAEQQNANDENPLSVFNDHIKKGDVSFVEMVMAGAFILFAGYETTTSLLSNCFVHLARNKELFNELKAYPEKLEDFIEESLRYYTPVGRFLRRANNDVEIAGKTIPKNTIVIVMPGAANTDPEKFENGCVFDMNRENSRQHLSFGKGAHFCIGASLARMQVRIALQELLNSAREISIDESQGMEMVTDRDNGIFRYESVRFKVTSYQDKVTSDQ
ncbi:MAG: cytochrome P450 [Bacteroidetes bacterium]|nr:cytochrome P450 [Bacteroidota bacterium]